ncbi:MAG: ATPase [Epsilonproteobacteria bacterium]|nr:MAG: ATPase [Campylobacterota bacterium]
MINDIDKLKNEIKKTIVGHDELIDGMLIALISGGHILVEGVPGVAKTTAVKSLCKAIKLNFKRIQFTPDLLPSDIIGHEILDMKNNNFKVKQGPIFTNMLLCDEINRAGAKVQSALLEAMAENQVTIGESSFKLQQPFMVMATSNPIEQDGTYELPEASLDRFMLKLKVDYNTISEEFEIVQKVVKKDFGKTQAILDTTKLQHLQNMIEDIHIDDELIKYIVKIVFATRQPENFELSSIKKYIEFGASPRGTISLFKASKAFALLNKKQFVTPYHISQMAYMTLRHRIRLSYEAVADDIDSDYIIKKILNKIPTP